MGHRHQKIERQKRPISEKMKIGIVGTGPAALMAGSQYLLQGFEMKKPSIFPSLPKNLSTSELRREIRRRLKISDELGLIRKPKKSDLRR